MSTGSTVPGADQKSLSEQALLRLEPLQLGQAFLRRGEYVGVVVSAADSDITYQLPPGVAVNEMAGSKAGLQAFTNQHPRYDLFRTPGGVLRLRPKTAGLCGRYLDHPVGAMSIDAPVLDVLAAIARQVNPEIPDVPAGLMGDASEEDRQPYVQLLRYSFAGGRLEEALDAAIQSASGLGWIIVERPPVPELGALESYCEATIFSGTTVVTGFTF